MEIEGEKVLTLGAEEGMEVSSPPTRPSMPERLMLEPRPVLRSPVPPVSLDALPNAGSAGRLPSDELAPAAEPGWYLACSGLGSEPTVLPPLEPTCPHPPLPPLNKKLALGAFLYSSLGDAAIDVKPLTRLRCQVFKIVALQCRRPCLPRTIPKTDGTNI